MVKRRTTAVFAALVLIPLGLAFVLGLFSLQESREKSKLQVQDLLSSRLEDLSRNIDEITRSQEQSLKKSLTGFYKNSSQSSSGQLTQDPWIFQFFLLDNKGRPRFPDKNNPSFREQDFWTKTQTLWDQGWAPRGQSERDGGNSTSGWKSWFWGQGTLWIFWTSLGSEGFAGVLVNQSALLGDVIARLSAPSIPETQIMGHRIRLLDSQGKTFLQWGRWNPQGPASPLVRRNLSGALDGWSLTYEMDETLWPQNTGTSQWALVAGLGALFLVLGALAFVFFRNVKKEIHRAAQRVSFVNQVSHELKTPLTNIRLYGELLESRILASDPKAQGYLDIIQRESRRLSRMIHNVLTFGRKEKESPLHLREGDLKEGVTQVLKAFEPSFKEKGLKLETQIESLGFGSFDPDVLDQILGNLLSNAEKYGASGERVLVEGRTQDDLTRLWVQDWGPGLPPGAQGKLFQPFEMFHTTLTEAAGGTGLGLHISRELCRRHGGDLVLEPSPQGCRFCASLNTGGKK